MPEGAEIGKTDPGKLALHVCRQVFDLQLYLAVSGLLILANLPPVPDSDQVVPLAPEDAAAHLRLATTRILDEQQKQQHALGRPTRNVLDW